MHPALGLPLYVQGSILGVLHQLHLRHATATNVDTVSVMNIVLIDS